MSAVRLEESRFEIDDMTLDDLDEVLDIERERFRAPWTPDLFITEFANPRSWRFVVKDRESGRVAGYLIYWMVLDEAHLMNVATAPAFARQGAGRCMIDHLIGECRARKAVRITLEVRKSNIAAINLYASYGFEGVGLRKNYYVEEKEDAILMELKLNG